MVRRIFKAQFERDLDRLKDAILHYKETGIPCNLFPCLFKVISHTWTMRGVLKKEFIEWYG